MARCKVRGFTFIELLIVFSVISVLTVLLAPSVHKMKERAAGRRRVSVTSDS
ncbi:MAG: type II secretion system protein [bacterium]|nr:type II secretion system protein [bacterium]